MVWSQGWIDLDGRAAALLWQLVFYLYNFLLSLWSCLKCVTFSTEPYARVQSHWCISFQPYAFHNKRFQTLFIDQLDRSKAMCSFRINTTFCMNSWCMFKHHMNEFESRYTSSVLDWAWYGPFSMIIRGVYYCFSLMLYLTNQIMPISSCQSKDYIDQWDVVGLGLHYGYCASNTIYTNVIWVYFLCWT